MNPAAVLALGFVLGMRHATDADHVVAVSTIVSQRQSLRSAAPIGMLWGIGHTLTILLVGALLILFGIAIPPRLGLSLELLVALMLVLLGCLSLGPRAERVSVARSTRQLGDTPVTLTWFGSPRRHFPVTGSSGTCAVASFFEFMLRVER